MKINDLNYAITNDGPDAQYERPIANLWAAICRMYFPDSTNILGGPVWAVGTEVNRGPANDMEAHIPDVVTVKLTPAQPTTQKRDYLWVECKKAALDRPSGWKDALEEAVIRLNSATCQPRWFPYYCDWNQMHAPCVESTQHYPTTAA